MDEDSKKEKNQNDSKTNESNNPQCSVEIILEDDNKQAKQILQESPEDAKGDGTKKKENGGKDSDNPNENDRNDFDNDENKLTEPEDMTNWRDEIERAGKFSSTLSPHGGHTPRQRKISFADDVESRISFALSDDHHDELQDLHQEVIPENETSSSTKPAERKISQEEDEDKKTKLAYLGKRGSRFSISSRFSFSSRPSFAGLTSRASIASLKSTITKVNSELYPERGSIVASTLGQSFADLPQPIAEKLYIVTQVLAAISVSIGSMSVGFNAAYTSPALASMDEPNSTLTLTADQKSWVGSLMPLSALSGSIVGGYLVDALGRKMLILICGPPLITAMLIIGSAYNISMLYAGRAIVGLCIGLLTLTLPVYLGETIQPEIRGTLGLLPTTFGNIGILICYSVGSSVNWSWLAYIGALIPIIFFFMMIFVPETPRWYVSKGKDEDAERSLQWLRGTDNAVEYELEEIQQNFDKTEGESSSFKNIFNKQYRKSICLCIGLMLVQQLSGINAVIFYTVDIFEMSGSDIDGHLSTIIVGVVNFMATFAANILIDKLGRKILLYISDIAMIISLFSLGSFFYIKGLSDPEDSENEWNELVHSLSWLPLLSFMVYVVAFSLGWGPIPWLFMGEALPAKIRGTAASLVTAFNWGCTFIVTKTFPGMVDRMGAYGVFFMFGVVMVIGLIFSFFFIPETKGKTLEEIEAELSGKKLTERQRRYSEMSGIVMK